MSSSTANTLNGLRISIGCIQVTHTYTEIQPSKVVRVDHRNELMMATLGLATIANVLQDAAMFYTHTNGYFGGAKMVIASEALAFLQGTGMDLCIRAYGLDLDPNQLRTSFYRIFHVKT